MGLTRTIFRLPNGQERYTPLLFQTPTGSNYISAIGVSPSNANFVYIGFYGGQIFASIPSGPCAFASCWTQIGGPGTSTIPPLPAAPVTSIAVDPTAPTTLYATYSGFNIGGSHVFKKTANGWSPFSSGLPDIPAHVIAIEPSNPQNLWLGTDQGVYSTIMGTPGSIWSLNLGAANGFLIPSNLPKVPVYDLSIDETNRRIIAATHGRGMWVLSPPLVYTEEGWVKMAGDTVGTIWDIPTFGNGFPADPQGRSIPCTVELTQQSGNVCAKGSQDALNSNIVVDAAGVLTTSSGSSSQGRPIVWSCFNTKCLGINPQNGNSPTIQDCNFKWVNHVRTSTADPVTSVKVVCGGPGTAFPLATGFAHVNGCPAVVGPPPNIFSIDPPPAIPSGSFQAVASVQIGSGGTRELCRATVPFAGPERPADILARVVDRINAQPSCTAQGVHARQQIPVPPSNPIEDDFRRPGILIQDALVTGGQVFLTASAPPGQTTGLCFNASELGVPATGALAIMRTAFSTTPGGAKGGNVTVTEGSPIGTCKQTIVTHPGDSPVAIATAVTAAFQSAAFPGTVDCPANQNPLDVVREEDAIVTVLPSSVTVCSNDTGVGFAVGPEDLMLKTCTPLPAVFGSNSTQIGDRVVVNRVGGGSGAVASGGAGGVTLGTDTVVGDVISVGSVTVRDRGRVDGMIETGGIVTLGNQTTVTGATVYATPNLPAPQGLPSSFPPSAGDIDVEANHTLPLAPGSYGVVAIKSRATINLTPGTYYVRSLDIEPQSTAHLDTKSGPVFIYIHDSLIFRGAFMDPLHSKSNLFIGFTGTSTVVLEASLEASFVAPSAQLILGTVPPPTFTGEFFAKDIQVLPGVIVSAQSFSCP